jgi:hypothetical protein
MILQPRDILTLEVLQRHGPLPTHFLYEFTKHIAKDRFGHSKRLLMLMREGYLKRPKQLNNELIFNDFKVYTLRQKGKEALAGLGKLHRYARPTGGGFYHLLLTALITASIELEVTQAGYRFIDQEEILAKAPNRGAQNPLALPVDNPATKVKSIVPDQLFGIDYGGAASFFTLETDRKTESVRSDLDANTYRRKIHCYRAVNASHAYRTTWGLPNILSLHVTVSEPHRQTILDEVKEITLKPNGSYGMSNFLTAVVPNVTHYQRLPREPFRNLWNEPWQRSGKGALDISKP